MVYYYAAQQLLVVLGQSASPLRLQRTLVVSFVSGLGIVAFTLILGVFFFVDFFLAVV